MKLVDIKEAINLTLKSNFPAIGRYSRETKEGFKKPCFFIELLPIMRIKENKAHYFRKITVLIRYFSLNKTELEGLKISDELEDVFLQPITIGDRKITIDEVESEFIDEVLVFQFDISYIDSLEEDKVYGYEDSELMQELLLEEV